MPEKPPPPGRRPTAAASWVRSLQCKSMAADDVVTTVAALPKKSHLLLRSSCGSSGDTHRDVSSCKPKLKSSSKTSSATKKPKAAKPTSVPPSPPPGPLGPLPALTELPAGHSSRQVVEIIFLSSWSPLPPAPPVAVGGAFTGEVEMLFRVHNQARAVARFEDYRAGVRARAGGASRSAADGNEMMRFSPAPPHGCSPSDSASLRVVRTFDGSGGAHASGRGPETGRRAMFLCRVIAGRVAEGLVAGEAAAKEYDSVRGGKGELVVFDRRAVLPCFLIIYKL
ncbi:hypothetical protein D1007_37320 [Hordeum vulgare]|uniref:Predicted protein n=1 Tax=Hordeum vulgare subsp. vulgare TaxID=112509 RepID=F2EAJ6_HORVV|nr:uncharacterized protein LOC123403231 [Hordeum vulgare subsp. vulgare]KAE8788612.1 hypothetical protein D1007_37320 [Hordeum vulgare]BAK04368.1 predicted protein [Hordeum vulgare subsp. vulgare]